MKYLLDTNAVIALLNDRHSKVSEQARHQTPADVGISSIVAYELFYGAFKSQRTQRNLALVDALAFQFLEFDKEDARKAGEMRAILAATGDAIGPYDLLIAGQAGARNLILVTHNTREFSRVQGLRTEDWER